MDIEKSQYFPSTVTALCLACNKFAPDKRRIVAHEGLTRHTREKLKRELGSDGLVLVEAAKFSKRPEVRLADSIAGVLAHTRFATNPYRYADLVPNWFVEL